MYIYKVKTAQDKDLYLSGCAYENWLSLGGVEAEKEIFR